MKDVFEGIGNVVKDRLELNKLNYLLAEKIFKDAEEIGEGFNEVSMFVSSQGTFLKNLHENIMQYVFNNGK